MNNPIALLLASFIASTSPLPTEALSFSGKRPVIEREIIEEDIFAMYRHVVSEHSNNDNIVMNLYDKYEALLKEEAKSNPQFSAELVLQSITYASEKHEGQERKYTGVPYIMHPISVSLILFEEGGVRDQYVLAAAALHDTIEDTDATSDEIQYMFGKQVRDLVEEGTNTFDLRVHSKHAWILEHAKNMSPKAQLIKAADRTHNLRSYNEIMFSEGSLLQQKKNAYFVASTELAKVLSGQNDKIDAALKAEIEAYFNQEH